jgi:hypothetical protein
MDDQAHWQHHRLLFWLAVAIICAQGLIVVLLILRK